MSRGEVRRVLQRRLDFIKNRLTQHFSDTETGKAAKKMFIDEVVALTIVMEEFR